MRTARRSVSSIADEHAHTDIPDRGSESVEALESDSRRWEGLGAPSDDRFLRRSSMEHWNVRPVVKEIAKGSARIAISAWMFTCLCSRLASVSSLYSDFLGRASALPTTTTVFSPPPRRLDLPWRQSWQFCKASITPTAENAPTIRGLVLLFGQARLEAREILSLAARQSWKTGNGL